MQAGNVEGAFVFTRLSLDAKHEWLPRRRHLVALRTDWWLRLGRLLPLLRVYEHTAGAETLLTITQGGVH